MLPAKYMTLDSPVEKSTPFARFPALAVLRGRDFRWYWISGFGMAAAPNVHQFAVAWLVLELTGSISQLGIVVAAMGLSMSIVGLWGGVIADRFDRKTVTIAAQSFTVANFLVLACLCLFEVVTPWHLYLSSMWLGVMYAVSMPARGALVRDLVDSHNLKNAVALNLIQMQASQVIWPAITGALITFAGLAVTLAVGGLVLALAVAALVPMKAQWRPRASTQANVMRDLVDGFRYSYTQPPISTAMGMAIFVAFLGYPYLSVAPGFAVDVLNLNAGETGLFLTAGGIGSVLGSSFLLLAKNRDNLRMYFVGSAFMGLCVTLVALSPVPLAAFLPSAGYGFCLSLMVVSGHTMFQAEATPAMLGRVTSVWGVMAGIGYAMTLPIGIAAESFGARPVLAATGILLITAVLFNGMVRTRILRLGLKSKAEESELMSG